jgi:hypothetical protein
VQHPSKGIIPLSYHLLAGSVNNIFALPNICTQNFGYSHSMAQVGIFYLMGDSAYAKLRIGSAERNAVSHSETFHQGRNATITL